MKITYLIFTAFTTCTSINFALCQGEKGELPHSIAKTFQNLDRHYLHIDSLINNYMEDEAEGLIVQYKDELNKTERMKGIKEDNPELNKHRALYILCKSRINMPFERGPAHDSVALELNKGIKYAKQSGDYKTIAAILFSKASLYQLEEKEKAILAAKEALYLGQKFRDDTIQAKAYDRLGRLFIFGKSKFIMSEYSFKAMDLYIELKMYEKAGIIAERIANFADSLSYAEQISLYLKSITLYKLSGNNDKLAYLYEHLARFYSHSHSNDTLQFALSMCDSALNIWNTNPNNNPLCKIRNLELSINCYRKLGKSTKINDQRRKQFEYAFSKQDSTLIVCTSINLADFYHDQISSKAFENKDSAIFYYNLAERFIPLRWMKYPIDFSSGLLGKYFHRHLSSDTSSTAISKIPFQYYIKLKCISSSFKAGQPINRLDMEALLAMSDSASFIFLNMNPINDYSKRAIEFSDAEVKEQDSFIENEREEKKTLKYFSLALVALFAGAGFSTYKAMKSNTLLKNALAENIRSQEVIREQDKRFHEEQLSKITVEQEMKVLRAQMNPHFIFNVLNSIHNCILNKDTLTASNNLTKFSRLIRSILDNSRKSLCTLHEEIATLELYVELEKMRFDGNFDFAINIDLELKQDAVFIPTLIIQPFIENSIWHGLMHSQRPGVITLNVMAEEQYLLISIEDNGVGRDFTRSKINSNGHESVGVSLTTDRIRYFNEGLPIETPLKIIDLYDSFGKATGTRVELILKRHEGGLEDSSI